MKKHNYNRHSNQYSTRDPRGLYLLLGTVIAGFVIKTAYDPTELYRPLVGVVEAKEVVQVIVEAPKLSIKDKIRLAFPEDPDMAVKVAFCESSLNPNAKSKGSTASGLFQIIRGTWKGYKCGDNPFDPDQNIACARKIYLRNGWGSTASWDASSNCWGK
jgi:hypothetical protein